jgi:hypothetical protein
LDDKNFFIDKSGRKIYTFKKETRQNEDRLKAIRALRSIIDTYNVKLNDNPTFGTNGKEYQIPNNITYNTVSTVTTGSSFILSSTAGRNSGSFDPSSTTFTFDQYISNVRVAPSASTATIEYYIATT